MKINTAALALLAASAAALPLSTINATLSAVNSTGSPFANATATATGPGESYNACVMPDGCRDKGKKDWGMFDPPRKTVPHVSSTKTRYFLDPVPTDVPPTTTTTTAEPTSSSRPSFGDWITSILLPGTSASSVSTETIITDTGFLPWPTISVVTSTSYTTFIPTVPNIPLQTPPTATETRPVLPTIRLPTPKTYTIIHPVLPTGEPVA